MYIHYKKVHDLPLIEDNYTPPVREHTRPSGSGFNFYLANTADSTKRILIKRRFAIGLILNSNDSDTSEISHKDIRLIGFLDNLTDTSVSFNLRYETIDLELKNGFRSNIYNDYDCVLEPMFRELNIRDIIYLEYSSPTRLTIYVVGAIVTGLSAITTLLVAPLVSIDYRNGGFNVDRYSTWAVASLGGLTIGIPLTILTTRKKYQITDNLNTTNKDYWCIKGK